MGILVIDSSLRPCRGGSLACRTPLLAALARGRYARMKIRSSRVTWVQYWKTVPKMTTTVTALNSKNNRWCGLRRGLHLQNLWSSSIITRHARIKVCSSGVIWVQIWKAIPNDDHYHLTVLKTANKVSGACTHNTPGHHSSPQWSYPSHLARAGILVRVGYAWDTQVYKTQQKMTRIKSWNNFSPRHHDQTRNKTI